MSKEYKSKFLKPIPPNSKCSKCGKPFENHKGGLHFDDSGDIFCFECGWKEQDRRVAEEMNNLFNAISVTNQSAKADAGKPQLHLVPTEIINCIARVREFGNKKYKDSNSWKRVEKERYIDAMFRHLLKYVNDNNSVDEESGMPHLWHLACNVAFLCEMEKDKE